MSIRERDSDLDELRALLRAADNPEERVEQGVWHFQQLANLSRDLLVADRKAARDAHVQWLWDSTAEPGTRAARAGRLRRDGERAVCTVEYHTHGRLVRCIAAGVQWHADVVDTQTR